MLRSLSSCAGTAELSIDLAQDDGARGAKHARTGNRKMHREAEATGLEPCEMDGRRWWWPLDQIWAEEKCLIEQIDDLLRREHRLDYDLDRPGTMRSRPAAIGDLALGDQAVGDQSGTTQQQRQADARQQRKLDRHPRGQRRAGAKAISAKQTNSANSGRAFVTMSDAL